MTADAGATENAGPTTVNASAVMIEEIRDISRLLDQPSSGLLLLEDTHVSLPLEIREFCLRAFPESAGAVSSGSSGLRFASPEDNEGDGRDRSRFVARLPVSMTSDYFP
jgi:hypothetical protein